MKQLSKKEVLVGYFSLIYGFYLFFVLISNYFDRSNDYWRFFYQFTQQSNIIVSLWLILLGLSTFFKWEKINLFLQQKIVIVAVTLYISITFLIVLFVLNPFYMGLWDPFSSTAEFMLHHASALVMWVLFFFIEGKGELTYRKIIFTLIYPLFYVILNLVVGYTTTYYTGEQAFAYGFINPNSYNNNFLIYSFVLLVLVLIFGGFSIGLVKLKLYINKVYHLR
jgi:hypothetical protein